MQPEKGKDHENARENDFLDGFQYGACVLSATPLCCLMMHMSINTSNAGYGTYSNEEWHYAACVCSSLYAFSRVPAFHISWA